MTSVDHDQTSRRDRLRGPAKFRVHYERKGDVHTICPSGELDLATVEDLERELQRAEASDAKAIVLDLAGLTFMDSTGVRLLLQAHARSRADAGRLTLLRGPAPIQRVLWISGVQDLLPFAD
jgi:anti-sigma B factor antagonist